MGNTDNISICQLIAESDDIPEDKKKIKLPHEIPVILGRSPVTGITNPELSRQQAIFTADCLKKTVEIFVKGPNSCGLNGCRLETNTKFLAKNGYIVELLLNSYRYRVEFVSDSTNIQKPNSLKHKNYLTNEVASKKKKTSNDSITSIDRSPTQVESMHMYDCGALYVYTSKGVTASEKIAAFDLDGTIIKPKSGNKFPKDKDDWQITYNNVPEKLKKLIEKDYKIVIFTNQKSTPKKQFSPNDFQSKLRNVFQRIGVPIQAFIATSDDKYRKPVTGMWNVLEQMNNDIPIEKSTSFYCGDAAGRKEDHSFADLLFAENLDLKFFTPENYFKGIPERPFGRPKFDPKTISKSKEYKNLLRDKPEIVVMVGFQGCGKSTLTQKMVTQSNGKYARINQDELKTMSKCLSVADNFIKSQRNIVIDNTNLDAETRSKWTNLAKKREISCRCIWLDLPFEHCLHNNFFRQLTNKNATNITSMIYNISKKKFVPPEVSEGFDEICKFEFVPEFKDKEKQKLYFQHLLG